MSTQPLSESAPTGQSKAPAENADNSNTIIRGPKEEEEENIGSENSNTKSSKSSSSSLAIILRRILGILNWVPPSCRYDPENPQEFTLALNLLFGFAATFTVNFSPENCFIFQLPKKNT